MKNHRGYVKQKGFTLVEMLVAMAVFTIISAGMMGWVNIAQRDHRIAYLSQTLQDNKEIARAFRKWANEENNGLLPDPYTDDSTYFYAPINVNSTDTTYATLLDYLASGSISSNSYNTDDTTAANVKVYQKISQESYSQPFDGTTSTTVTLLYDIGVIYQTDCAQSDSSCNSSLPGSSETFSSATSWEAEYPDVAPVEVSTLDIQQHKWENTRNNLFRIRDKMRDGFRYSQLAATAGDLSNFFYEPSDTTYASDSGQLDCNTYWYDLSQSDVLTYYGIGPIDVYGTTQWGGKIDYCPDYDPLSAGADVAPHNAALRFNKSVTEGLAPTNTSSENIIIII